MILLAFKLASDLIFKFVENKYYYSNLKPENFVLDSASDSSDLYRGTTYDLKLIDLGSLTDNLQVNAGNYTETYFISELALQRKNG